MSAAKSPAQKRLNGNAGKRKISNTRSNLPKDAPKCPTFLKGAAKKEWSRITPILDSQGLLATTDLAVLTSYCVAWGHYTEAEKKVRELGMVITTPNGSLQKSPWLSISDKAHDQLKKAVAELGLSPKARNTVVGTPKDDDDSEFFS